LEVLSLIAVLADKISISSEPWQMNHLAMVMFGLQGMSSDSKEVASLLTVIAQKAVNLLPEKCVDVNDIANCLFGFQRMNITNPDVCRIIEVLLHKMSIISTPTSINARVCANAIFGVHALSCTEVTVQKVLHIISNWMKQISSSFVSIQRSTGHTGIFGLEQISDQGYSFDRVEDILALYQSATLSLFAMRDLGTDPELQARLYAELSSLLSIIDTHKADVPPPILTAAERRMTRELTDILCKEPYNVITSVVVDGFEMASYIQLYQGLQLKTCEGHVWTPVLNLEVRGSSYSFPGKELFFTLRKHYLQYERGIVVDYVPAESFRIEGQHGLKIHSNVLSPLYPPTMEDATQFALRLHSLQKAGKLGMPHIGPDGFFSFNGSTSNTGNTGEHVISDGPHQSTASPTLEYLDDDFKRMTSAASNNRKYKFIQSYRNEKVPLRFPLGWLGDWPVVSHSMGSAYSSVISPADCDEGALTFSVRVSNSLSKHSDKGRVEPAMSTLTSGGQYGVKTGATYQEDLNKLSPPSSLSIGLCNNGIGTIASRSVGFRASGVDDSDSSLASANHSIHHIHSNTSSGNVDTLVATLEGIEGSHFPMSSQEGTLSSLQVDGIASRGSSSSDVTPTSNAQRTVILGYPSAPFGHNASGSSLLSRVTEEMEHDSPSGQLSGVDDEIAALEAQLEVARIEARLKELKTKKGTFSTTVGSPKRRVNNFSAQEQEQF